MRWTVPLVAVSVLLAGSIGSLNSPGPAPDPIHASQSDLEAYIDVTEAMHARWQALDAACDPDAIFALLYLVTTAKVGDLVAASHFADNPFLVEWDQDFASRYFDAYDAHHAGRQAPEPWQKAFDHAASGRSTVTEDLLLGMNAHVNYDLAFSAYHMGLPQNGLKDEFDRVNDAFWNVVVPVGDEMGARYDPGQARDGSGELGPFDYAVVELLISWRENAWNNAVLLAQAPDPLTFAAVEAKIESEANTIAQGFLNDNGDTATGRVAYCEASGHPPLDASLGGPGYGDDWVSQVEEPGSFLVCHAPGRSDQKEMTVNEHAWHAHDHHGDERGACAS